MNASKREMFQPQYFQDFRCIGAGIKIKYGPTVMQLKIGTVWCPEKEGTETLYVGRLREGWGIFDGPEGSRHDDYSGDANNTLARAAVFIGIMGNFQPVLTEGNMRGAFRICLLLILTSLGFAQPRVAFEVASIKRSFTPTRNPSRITPGRAQYNNFSLRDLIAVAYRIQSSEVSAPNWLDDARFNIDAKIPQDVSEDRVSDMVRTLLIERFRLSARHTTKEGRGFVVRVGLGGAKLSAVPIGNTLELRSREVPTTIQELAYFLWYRSSLPVIDETGIAGKFYATAADQELLELQRRPNFDSGAISGKAQEPESASPVPLMRAAVQKLGLILDGPRKVAIPIVVVDSIEKEPTEN